MTSWLSRRGRRCVSLREEPTLNLPNQITLSRLVLSVAFFAVLTQYSHHDTNRQPFWLDLGVVLFVVAACTDFVDGYLARSRGLVTPLGRVLDPFVDKVLICGAFILLCGQGFVDAQGQNVTRVQPWMVVIIVGRELLVTGLRGYQESVGKAFPAGLHGKIKMWVQSFAVPAILLAVAHEGSWFSSATSEAIKLTFAWLTVLATALSVFQYLARSRDLLLSGAAA